jgi:hypothetical protein
VGEHGRSKGTAPVRYSIISARAPNIHQLLLRVSSIHPARPWGFAYAPNQAKGQAIKTVTKSQMSLWTSCLLTSLSDIGSPLGVMMYKGREGGEIRDHAKECVCVWREKVKKPMNRYGSSLSHCVPVHDYSGRNCGFVELWTGVELCTGEPLQ